MFIFGHWGIICLICPWKCLRVLCTVCGSSHVPADPSCVCTCVHVCVRAVPDAASSPRRAMTTQRAAFARPACSVSWLSTPWLARISNPTWHSSRAARYGGRPVYAFTHTHTHTDRRTVLSYSHVVISQQVWTGCPIIKLGVIFALLFSTCVLELYKGWCLTVMFTWMERPSTIRLWQHVDNMHVPEWSDIITVISPLLSKRWSGVFPPVDIHFLSI